jgi:hypothetical protein
MSVAFQTNANSRQSYKLVGSDGRPLFITLLFLSNDGLIHIAASSPAGTKNLGR